MPVFGPGVPKSPFRTREEAAVILTARAAPAGGVDFWPMAPYAAIGAVIGWYLGGPQGALIGASSGAGYRYVASFHRPGGPPILPVPLG